MLIDNLWHRRDLHDTFLTYNLAGFTHRSTPSLTSRTLLKCFDYNPCLYLYRDQTATKRKQMLCNRLDGELKRVDTPAVRVWCQLDKSVCCLKNRIWICVGAETIKKSDNKLTPSELRDWGNLRRLEALNYLIDFEQQLLMKTIDGLDQLITDHQLYNEPVAWRFSARFENKLSCSASSNLTPSSWIPINSCSIALLWFCHFALPVEKSSSK